MRVAFDATPLLGVRTGVGAFCAGALEGLAARSDVEVRAFAVSWRRRRGILPQLPAGIAAVGRPMPARPLHLAWRHAPTPPVEVFTGTVDVVHGTNFVVPPSWRAARAVTVHDLTTVRYPELCDESTRAFPRLLRRALASGAWVHTPSAYVAGEVTDLLGADPRRVRTVHHGVPVRGPAGSEAGEQPVARPARMPPGVKRYVLALGTIEPRKDMPGLVQAFDELASTRPEVHLVVAGPDGWGSSAFARAVDRAHARSRVIRLGFVSAEERAWLLDHADVLAYPSLYEGFGFPPLEAMASGVPVVTTDAGALPEVVGDGAEVVRAGDVASLAWGLGRVLDDERHASSLVRRGRATAARYSWSACASGLAALYRDAAAERGTSR
jgi:glycosyltransferase involved in cell wall biosynthesis